MITNTVNGEQFFGSSVFTWTPPVSSIGGSSWGGWFRNLAQGSLDQIVRSGTDALSRKIGGGPSAYEQYQYDQQLKYDQQQSTTNVILIGAAVLAAVMLFSKKGNGGYGGYAGDRRSYRYSEEG